MVLHREESKNKDKTKKMQNEMSRFAGRKSVSSNTTAQANTSRRTANSLNASSTSSSISMQQIRGRKQRPTAKRKLKLITKKRLQKRIETESQCE